MHEFRFLRTKSQSVVNAEWDEIAAERSRQLSSHEDRSFEEVLAPWILSRASDYMSVVDIGCGTGHLTAMLAAKNDLTVGIDPSPRSIQIAKEASPGVDYRVASAQQWARESSAHYSLAVANMVLMDTLDLKGTLSAVNGMIPGGRFIATIAHPSFWPMYWGYVDDSRFRYDRELIIEAPFRTRTAKYSQPTTHIHRPLAQYLSAFRQTGFNVVEFVELRGPESESQFPFPRFIGMVAFAK